MGSRLVEPLALRLPAAERGGYLSQCLAAATPALAAARDELVAEWQSMDEQGPMAAQRLLNDYRGAGGRRARHSRLGQILGRARLLADRVDRVVVVAGPDVCLAAKAVLDSCAHPYHNKLSRAQRGGYPRIEFEAGPVDNDALAGLLDVLAPPQAIADLDHRWALVSVEDGMAETALKTQVLAQALATALGGGRDGQGELLVKLPGPGQPGTGDPFTSGVLLPAALAGVDIVGLLSGAEAMIERFVHDSPQDCPVLQLAGLLRLQDRSPRACRIAVWPRALESVGRRYGQLRRQACVDRPIDSQENGSEPANDLHCHLPAEKIGGEPVGLQIIAERLRRDRLMNDEQAILPSESVPESSAIALRLPRIDERSIGQLLQLLVLATAVEVRLTRA